MPDADGFRIDIACADQPRESDPCAVRDGSAAAANGVCVTCARNTGPAEAEPPGYPTPELESATGAARTATEQTRDALKQAMKNLGIKPGQLPTSPDTIYAHFSQMNDQIATFHAARRIAENQALLSSRAVEQIRALYVDYDAKHPATQEEQQP
ncbi:hypothetical protein [Mycobacterium asiaticum]|uniref:Uncharacterized protein n=1 Tax=Mycobacterium asiaticum TaxID=1790 RepID=A0A1A3NQF4_MYCAS|nr:hypothetical protein [Mycobacterium asiaticum]OBK22542.1 hypothetical protein A5635_21745 [Mycobacterium asiaticum]